MVGRELIAKLILSFCSTSCVQEQSVVHEQVLGLELGSLSLVYHFTVCFGQLNKHLLPGCNWRCNSNPTTVQC